MSVDISKGEISRVNVWLGEALIVLTVWFSADAQLAQLHDDLPHASDSDWPVTPQLHSPERRRMDIH